ncbi:MAG: hypothetical protein K9H48_14115 [Melioribacteraceae bacterium]|nr:hypothetical protein [Melioribacteraceae bacterium]
MKIYLAALILFLTFNSPIFTQTMIDISGLGGVNYIPMKEFSHFLNSFDNAKSDKIAFSGNAKLHLKLNSNHNIYLSGEFISNNASLSGGFVTLVWNFEFIPITVGYEYSWVDDTKSWFPYLGLGFSYVLQNSEIKYLGDDGIFTTNYSSNSFGFETHCGIEKSIADKLKLISEIKYRFMGDLKTSEFSRVEETNLSGIGILFGIKFSLL